MGKIARRFTQRAHRAGEARRQMRNAVGRQMLTTGREGLEKQLYSVTPLPVTRAMFRALRTWSDGNRNRVTLGFKTPRAPHTPFRLKMKGTSKTGGHRLDMNLQGHMRSNARPLIRAIVQRYKARIIR